MASRLRGLRHGMWELSVSGATRRDRGKLGGLKRNGLIRALALEDVTQAALAERYGVTEGAITQFKHREAEAIQALRDEAENEFAGILIAQKANRLRALEELFEVARTPTPKVAPNGKIVREYVTNEDGLAEEVVVQEVDVRAAAGVLKQAAEEMGQLVARTQVSGDMNTTTTYRIEGVSPDDLR